MQASNAVNKPFKDPLKNNTLNGRFAELMNREWVLGAGSIISSDSIIRGYKVPCILDDLNGSKEDPFEKAVLEEAKWLPDDTDASAKDAREEQIQLLQE